MKYIILISPHNYQLNEMKKLIEVKMNTHLNKDDDVLSIKTEKGYINIRHANEVLNDFDEDEIQTINSFFSAPEAYLVNYNNIDEVKQVLKCIADREDIFIDTDTGYFMNGKEFNRRCEIQPEWDWLDD